MTTYYYNPSAFDGSGGYCINVDARTAIGNQTLTNLHIDGFYTDDYFVTNQVSLEIVTVEANS